MLDREQTADLEQGLTIPDRQSIKDETPGPIIESFEDVSHISPR